MRLSGFDWASRHLGVTSTAGGLKRYGVDWTGFSSIFDQSARQHNNVFSDMNTSPTSSAI